MSTSAWIGVYVGIIGLIIAACVGLVQLLNHFLNRRQDAREEAAEARAADQDRRMKLQEIEKAKKDDDQGKKRADTEKILLDILSTYNSFAAGRLANLRVLEDETWKKVCENKVLAQEWKNVGNAAYKHKNFEAAILYYNKAMELDDDDIAYITNRAAVFLEMGQYEDSIKDCDKAIERGREILADRKMIAKALTRKGKAYVKMANCSNDYEPAIEAFHKALIENPDHPGTLKLLSETYEAKRHLELQENHDHKIAEEERDKGDGYFKQQKYPEAIKHYAESLRRNPKEPKTYSNRAVCYIKLGAMPEALKDAEKCIELDPTFSKGYITKGAVHFFMHEYVKAMETYLEGLKHDLRNPELLAGIGRCVEAQGI